MEAKVSWNNILDPKMAYLLSEDYFKWRQIDEMVKEKSVAVLTDSGLSLCSSENT